MLLEFQNQKYKHIYLMLFVNRTKKAVKVKTNVPENEFKHAFGKSFDDIKFSDLFDKYTHTKDMEEVFFPPLKKTLNDITEKDCETLSDIEFKNLLKLSFSVGKYKLRKYIM